MFVLDDLLKKLSLDAERVMVMRHRPTEAPLRAALPWLVAERRELFDWYQGFHSERTEKALSRAAHLVSFLGEQPGKALFVGLYDVTGARELAGEDARKEPSTQELLKLGDRGPEPGRTVKQFQFRLRPELAGLQGRLVLEWPGLERSWWRWAARNEFRVHALHEESQLVRPMPSWRELVLEWSQLRTLPASWRAALGQWRGVYLVLDGASGKAYVGSAAGQENILGRWDAYAATGDGGNKGLRGRDPREFRFSVLERVAPDMPVEEVVAIEDSWKRRLGTRDFGLNEN